MLILGRDAKTNGHYVLVLAFSFPPPMDNAAQDKVGHPVRYFTQEGQKNGLQRWKQKSNIIQLKHLGRFGLKKGFAQIMFAPEKHPHFIYNFANWSSYVWGLRMARKRWKTGISYGEIEQDHRKALELRVDKAL